MGWIAHLKLGANTKETVPSYLLPYTSTFNEAVELRSRILEEAEKLGLPLYAPIELHIIGKEELRKYLKKGKVLPVNKI